MNRQNATRSALEIGYDPDKSISPHGLAVIGAPCGDKVHQFLFNREELDFLIGALIEIAYIMDGACESRMGETIQ